MSRALQGVKVQAMQTSGRRAFWKEGRTNKEAEGKGTDRLRDRQEASVTGAEPERAQKLRPTRGQGIGSQSLLGHCEL